MIRRMTAIMLEVCRTPLGAQPKKVPACPRGPKVPLGTLLERSGHTIIRGQHRYQCTECLQACATHELRRWLEGMNRSKYVCPGSPFIEGVRPRGEMLCGPIWVGGAELHPSHVLTRFRGIVFCHRCGSLATQAPLGLQHPCSGHKSDAGRRVVDYLHRDPPKLPTNVGLRKWPELPGERTAVGTYDGRSGLVMPTRD